MREPADPGDPIDADRMREWLAEFGSYRINVTEERIDRWLAQFDEPDRDIAARVLDAVQFIPLSQASSAYRDLLAALPGWSQDPNERDGRWFFVPFSPSPGKSGDHMVTVFRHANNMSGRAYDDLFVHSSDLVSLTPSPEDTVVFIDDFSGTGNQAVGWWDHPFRELLPLHPRIYLLLVAATDQALLKISNETRMTPMASIGLDSSDNLFSSSCKAFSDSDKSKILDICSWIDPRNPKGVGDCGLLVVFGHTCPNNSIPLLHARVKRRWDGLFRRYD